MADRDRDRVGSEHGSEASRVDAGGLGGWRWEGSTAATEGKLFQYESLKYNTTETFKFPLSRVEDQYLPDVLADVIAAPRH